MSDIPIDKMDAFRPKDGKKMRKLGKKRAGDIQVGEAAFGVYVGNVKHSKSRLGMDLVEIFSEDGVLMYAGEADDEVDLDLWLEESGVLYLTFERALADDPDNPVLVEMKNRMNKEKIAAQELGQELSDKVVDKAGRPAPEPIEVEIPAIPDEVKERQSRPRDEKAPHSDMSENLDPPEIPAEKPQIGQDE